MSKSKRIALFIMILGIIFSGITLYLGLNHKFNDSIKNIYYFIIILGTIIETLFAVYFLIRMKRKALLHGEIIYQFSKSDNKKGIAFIILYVIFALYLTIELFNKPNLIIICVMWMLLTIILMNIITVFAKKGISKIGIDSLSWNEIEGLELDKNNRYIKYKANGWTRSTIHKIADNDWDDNIQEFITQYYHE